MRNLFLLIILSSIFLTNCAPTGYVQFDGKKTDMVTTDELKSYLQENKNPSIVLRVPNSSKNPTEGSTSNFLNSTYNTIEKELLKAGFNVRDRALFNEILSKTGEKIDYSELQSKTNTDLILQLVNIDPKVEFTTNTYYTSSDEKKTFEDGYSLSAYGAKIEFKVVLIKENQYAGNYVFYYQPCSNKCPIKIHVNTNEPSFVNRVESGNEKDINEDPYQYVSKSAFQSFIEDASQQLIKAMRNGNQAMSKNSTGI